MKPRRWGVRTAVILFPVRSFDLHKMVSIVSSVSARGGVGKVYHVGFFYKENNRKNQQGENLTKDFRPLLNVKSCPRVFFMKRKGKEKRERRKKKPSQLCEFDKKNFSLLLLRRTQNQV